MKESKINLETISLIAGLVVSCAVGNVVGHAANAVIPKGTKGFNKLLAIIGSYAIASYVGAKIGDYAGEEIKTIGETLSGDVSSEDEVVEEDKVVE